SPEVRSGGTVAALLTGEQPVMPLPDFLAIAESERLKYQQRKQAAKLQAEEHGKRGHLSKAFYETAHFAHQDAEGRLGKKLSLEEFCRYWAEQFVQLGEQLKAHNLVARLEQLDLEDQVKAYTVGLYKLGCVGDENAVSQLTALLLTVCKT